MRNAARRFVLIRVLVALVLLSLLAQPARGQGAASIAGLVKDTSDAVLPGVTVEAASEALIEKTHTVVTDSTGQYKIVNLPPGTYAVTMTLGGFSTFRREGVELTGSFVAPVNAELRVGPVTATVTVSGAAPLVDLQSATAQKVITKDLIDATPSGRSGVALAALIPGMITGGAGGLGQGTQSTSGFATQDVGGQTGDVSNGLSIHGSKPGEMRTTMNGLSIATSIRFGDSPGTAPSLTSMQEVSINYGGADASLPAGGVQLNYVPREGGNRFNGLVWVTGANGSLQASNYDDTLKARGLSVPNSLKKIYDINPGFGGPIKKDRLWFFFAVRATNPVNYVAGNYPNLNAGKKDVWTYVPDTSKPQGISEQYSREETLRLTWQAAAKHKVGLYWADKFKCQGGNVFGQGCYSVAPALSSDAIGYAAFYPFSDQMAEWSSPLTTRLLLEAGIFHHQETWGQTPAPFDMVDPSMVGVMLSQAPAGQTITFYRGVSGPPAQRYHTPNYRARFAVSYVTGAHSAKIGLDQSWSSREGFSFSFIPYSYIFNSAGIPMGLMLRSDDFPTPIFVESRVRADGGAFAQDRWTRGRLTLTGGVRLDWFNAYQPEQSLGPSTLTPNRNITFPEYQTLDWKDVTPKMGMAFDVFGSGKTALRVSLGKYVLGQAGFAGNGLATAGPATNVVTVTTRNWNDSFFPVGDPRRGNYVPDCNLVNVGANGECGPDANPAFGSTAPATTIDPDIKFGWNKRQYSWEFAVSAQHQLATGVSVNGGFYRRWFGNFYVTDNLAVGSADFTPYSITAPLDSRLPSGGGYVITDVYNIIPPLFGVTNNLQTFASRYGNQIDHWNGFGLDLNARLPHGLMFVGGIDSGYQTTDNCEIVAQVPESALQGFGYRFCHVDYPWLTQLKFLTSYTVPKVGIQLGATFQNQAGLARSATWQALNAQVSAGLGRDVSGTVNNAGTTPLALIAPNIDYGDRLNLLDIRIGKLLKAGRTRSVISLDLFNALNTNPVTSESSNFSNWQTPLAVLPARLVKVALQFDF